MICDYSSQCVFSGSCATVASAFSPRQVPLSCCSDLPSSCSDVQPELLSARKISVSTVIDCWVIVCPSIVFRMVWWSYWHISLPLGHGLMWLVGSWLLRMVKRFLIFSIPTVTRRLQCTVPNDNVVMTDYKQYINIGMICFPRKKSLALKAYTCMDRGWALVGVSDDNQLNVWRGTDELPSVTVNVRASEGDTYSVPNHIFVIIAICIPYRFACDWCRVGSHSGYLPCNWQI